MGLFGKTEHGHTLAVAEPPVMERAKAQIQTVPRHDKEELEAEIVRQRQLRTGLMGVEVRASQQIDVNIAQLSALVKREELRGKIGDLPRVDPVVLTWRKKIKVHGNVIPVPELALYSLHHPTLKLRVEWVGRENWTPDLPDFAIAAYKDTVDALAKTIDSGHSQAFTLTTTYDGVIPAETKEKIREAEEQFEDVRLLAEAPNWSVHIEPRHVDPIVVGIAAETMWVIDIFDPTPVEEYVASEFTI